MQQLTLVSQLIGYALIAVIGVYTLILSVWQARVLAGKGMANPDGSVDDWHVQQTHYGIAIADLCVTAPAVAAGILLLAVGSRWGHSVLALVGFWLVWSNVMTTATSLRFHKPRVTVAWVVAFPLGIVIGLAYLVWTVVHFDHLH